ncbi:hypothetical protein ACYOEI_13530 [Singulisphaera rosea]
MPDPSNPSPRPKVTINQWMILLAVVVGSNDLAVLLVRMILSSRVSADQLRSHTAFALFILNGFVMVYVVFYLFLDGWSKEYHHKRGLPYPPSRCIVWQGEKGLVFGLFLTLIYIAVQSDRVGAVGPGLTAFQAGPGWVMFLLSFGLSAWVMKTSAGKATEQITPVNHSSESASHPNQIP